MDSDNNTYGGLYCPEDDEYRVNCEICDNLCIERFHKNHLESQTHNNVIRNIKKWFQIVLTK